MAMVVALHCGKKVVSFIPPDGNKCTLAQEKIEKLIENYTIFMSQPYIIFL